MMISTKGRYALRVLLDLAENQKDGYIAMKTVAERQGLSLKYIEKIMPALAKNGYVEGIHGKGGGYRLCRSPEAYTVGEILRLTDGDLAPVACLACDAALCDRQEMCKTLPMWRRFYDMTNDYFDSIRLSDLLSGEVWI